MVNEHVFDKLNSELENIHQLYKSTVENNLTPNDVRKTINNEVGKGTFPDGYDHNKFGQYVGDQHGVSPDNTSIKLDAAGDHTPYNKTLPKPPTTNNTQASQTRRNNTTQAKTPKYIDSKYSIEDMHHKLTTVYKAGAAPEVINNITQNIVDTIAHRGNLDVSASIGKGEKYPTVYYTDPETKTKHQMLLSPEPTHPILSGIAHFVEGFAGWGAVDMAAGAALQATPVGWLADAGFLGTMGLAAIRTAMSTSAVDSFDNLHGKRKLNKAFAALHAGNVEQAKALGKKAFGTIPENIKNNILTDELTVLGLGTAGKIGSKVFGKVSGAAAKRTSNTLTDLQAIAEGREGTVGADYNTPVPTRTMAEKAQANLWAITKNVFTGGGNFAPSGGKISLSTATRQLTQAGITATDNEGKTTIDAAVKSLDKQLVDTFGTSRPLTATGLATFETELPLMKDGDGTSYLESEDVKSMMQRIKETGGLVIHKDVMEALTKSRMQGAKVDPATERVKGIVLSSMTPAIRNKVKNNTAFYNSLGHLADRIVKSPNYKNTLGDTLNSLAKKKEAFKEVITNMSPSDMGSKANRVELHKAKTILESEEANLAQDMFVQAMYLDRFHNDVSIFDMPEAKSDQINHVFRTIRNEVNSTSSKWSDSLTGKSWRNSPESGELDDLYKQLTQNPEILSVLSDKTMNELDNRIVTSHDVNVPTYLQEYIKTGKLPEGVDASKLNNYTEAIYRRISGDDKASIGESTRYRMGRGILPENGVTSDMDLSVQPAANIHSDNETSMDGLVTYYKNTKPELDPTQDLSDERINKAARRNELAAKAWVNKIEKISSEIPLLSKQIAKVTTIFEKVFGESLQGIPMLTDDEERKLKNVIGNSGLHFTEVAALFGVDPHQAGFSAINKAYKLNSLRAVKVVRHLNTDPELATEFATMAENARKLDVEIKNLKKMKGDKVTASDGTEVEVTDEYIKSREDELHGNIDPTKYPNIKAHLEDLDVDSLSLKDVVEALATQHMGRELDEELKEFLDSHREVTNLLQSKSLRDGKPVTITRYFKHKDTPAARLLRTQISRHSSERLSDVLSGRNSVGAMATDLEKADIPREKTAKRKKLSRALGTTMFLTDTGKNKKVFQGVQTTVNTYMDRNNALKLFGQFKNLSEAQTNEVFSKRAYDLMCNKQIYNDGRQITEEQLKWVDTLQKHLNIPEVQKLSPMKSRMILAETAIRYSIYSSLQEGFEGVEKSLAKLHGDNFQKPYQEAIEGLRSYAHQQSVIMNATKGIGASGKVATINRFFLNRSYALYLTFATILEFCKTTVRRKSPTELQSLIKNMENALVTQNYGHSLIDTRIKSIHKNAKKYAKEYADKYMETGGDLAENYLTHDRFADMLTKIKKESDKEVPKFDEVKNNADKEIPAFDKEKIKKLLKKYYDYIPTHIRTELENYSLGKIGMDALIGYRHEEHSGTTQDTSFMNLGR